MLHVTGEEKFDRPPELLWQSLLRPEFLCQCFPGVDRVLRTDDRSAALIVRPGFSFVRGTLEIAFEFADLQPPQSARVLIHIKGIGSSAELATQFEIAPDVGGSVVNWTIDALQLGGLLKAVSQGLMQAAAQKVANDTWLAFRNRLPPRNG